MTYDIGNLHGAWENLDDDSILELDAGGDFRLSESSLSIDQRVNVVGDISGKWRVDDNKLKLSVDLRSVRLSSSSRLTRLGLKVFSLLLRFVREKDIVDDEITRLTDTDLWLESPDGKVSRFLKKLRRRQ